MIKLKNLITEKKETNPPKKDKNPVFTITKKIPGLKYPVGKRFGYTGARYSPEGEEYNDKWPFKFFAEKFPKYVSYSYDENWDMDWKW